MVRHRVSHISFWECVLKGCCCIYIYRYVCIYICIHISIQTRCAQIRHRVFKPTIDISGIQRDLGSAREGPLKHITSFFLFVGWVVNLSKVWWHIHVFSLGFFLRLSVVIWLCYFWLFFEALTFAKQWGERVMETIVFRQFTDGIFRLISMFMLV